MADFDPSSIEDMTRLRRAIREQRERFKPYYENRKVLQEALSDPVHRSVHVDTLDRKPHNALDKALRIITRSVVDQNPTLRVVRTKQPRTAGMLKAQLDVWGRQIGMADVLQGMFQEAWLRWGIAYTGYETPDIGRGMAPFVHVLDFDDYFIDDRGNDETDIDFEGHYWSVRIFELENNESYNQEAVAKLRQSAKTRYRNQVSTIYDWVDVRTVWLPHEGIEVTITDDDNNSIPEPLRVRPYIGPPPGPYVRLSFGNVRGNMIPVSRASMLYDLHEFIMRAYRQVYKQADRSLEFFAYSGEAEKDAEKHRVAQDGEYVNMENPAGVQRVKKGGVDPQTLAAAIHADDLFDSDAGNLKLMGGLGPSAETLGQERGLGAGVQAMIDDFRQKMNKLAKRLYEVGAWYILNDPFNGRSEEFPNNAKRMVEWVTSNGNTVSSEWSPDSAFQLDPSDPDMEIVPGSMVSRSAEGQLQALIQSFQVIAGAMALPGAKPGIFDLEYFTKLIAEYSNQPEIEKLFTTATDSSSVAPGAEGATQFGQQKGSATPPQGAGGQPQQNKLAERLIFSGGANQPGNGQQSQ